MSEQDPMLVADAKEQADYRKGVMDVVRNAIEEDRRSRRQPQGRPETPATLLGATGLPNGLMQSL